MTAVRWGGSAHGASTAAGAFVVDVAIRGHDVTIAVSGTLELASIERFHSVSAAVLTVPGIARVEVDGSGVGFIDSTGLRALMLARSEAEACGVSWFLGALSPALARILELSGIGPRLGDHGRN